jgi:hypothetical protein
MQPGAVAVTASSQRFRNNPHDQPSTAANTTTGMVDQMPSSSVPSGYLSDLTPSSSAPIIATVVDRENVSHPSTIQSIESLKKTRCTVFVQDRRIQLLVLVSILIIGGLVAGLVISLTKNNSSTSASTNPQGQDSGNGEGSGSGESPSASPTMMTLETFLASVSPDGGAALSRASSPQRQALEELQSNPNLFETYDESRLKQMYAAQVFRYAILKGSGVDIVTPLNGGRRHRRRQLVAAKVLNSNT